MKALAKICWKIFVPISAKTCLIEIARRNLKKSSKIAWSNKNFHCNNTKKNHPDKYRNNNKNYKVSKSSDIKKKVKNALKNSANFAKIGKVTRICIAITTSKNANKIYHKNKKNNKFSKNFDFFYIKKKGKEGPLGDRKFRKNPKSDRNFHSATTKHANKYLKNNKNNKLSKVQTWREWQRGPSSKSKKFTCKTKTTLTNILQPYQE